MEDNLLVRRSIAGIALIFALIVGFSFGYLLANPFEDTVKVFRYPLDGFLALTDSTGGEIAQFESQEEFEEYMAASQSLGYKGFGGGMERTMAQTELIGIDSGSFGLSKTQDIGSGGMGGSSVPSRVSDTNVQVFDIDEADILKTNGQQLFYSTSNGYFRGTPEPFFDEMNIKSIAPPRETGGIKIVDAFPPAELSLAAEIDIQGEMFLAGDNLIVNFNREIVAYNVTDTNNPVEDWSIQFEDRSYLVTSRLYGDELYLITRTRSYSPVCPITPLTSERGDMIVNCTDVYHPVAPASVDSTYSIVKVNAENGEVLDQVSFVASYDSASIYMSKDSIYLTYNQQADILKFTIGFMLENDDLYPQSVIEQLIRVNNYDLSNQSKIVEMETIMNKWMMSLSNDDRLRFENEMENRMTDYFKDHARELEQTNIVKIDVDNLKIKANGQVPGRLLNQFSLDEYNGNLRVATTIGERSFGESMNDIYVLNSKMGVIGSVENLGLDERIYSVRFLGDMGYVVTFKQIDPFYILDLSDPKNPKMTGELKIPGYSSYLHPIAENRILGIGEEDRKVKVSLFDVSDKTNPREIAKYSLDEYWSEAGNNHHAFLADSKFKVFFIPGGKGGYIFSYANDKLELTKAIAGYNVKRAMFIDDYFYIVGDEGVKVYNENDWLEINSLDFNKR
jgi:inhibitor of cysteine peptidase